MVLLDKRDGKDWRHGAKDLWTTVEIGDLDYYRSIGWDGAASKGGRVISPAPIPRGVAGAPA